MLVNDEIVEKLERKLGKFIQLRLIQPEEC